MLIFVNIVKNDYICPKYTSMVTDETARLKILEQRNPRMILAEVYAKKLIRNVYGIGYQEYLAQINNYENNGQYEARKKHAVSNKAETANLLNPTKKIWNAKGGGVNLNFDRESKDNLEKNLLDVNGGQTMSEYMKNEYFNQLITDPNGVQYFPVEKKGNKDLVREEYISSFNIWDYELNGIELEYLAIFKKLDKEDNKEIYEVKIIDDAAIYLYEVTGIKDTKVTFKKMTIHTFKRVPGYVNSPLKNYNNTLRLSPIDKQVELLDRLAVSTSVLSINEFFYNYIRSWEFSGKCKVCDGHGTISSKNREGNPEKIACPTCEGQGYAKRDVTDTLKMRPPASKEDPIITEPFGYIYVPTDAWEYQTDSIKDKRNFVFYSLWGSTYEVGENSNTATGRFIDAQPVYDVLDDFSTIIEKAHQEGIDIIGIYHYPETFKQSEVRYGRRYMIETPDQIWEKYLNAKEKKAPESMLDRLLFQYLSSEFRDSTTQFLIEFKKVKVEPFVHQTISEVINSDFVAEPDKQAKSYYSEWSKTIDIAEWKKESEEKLRDKLYKYSSNKSKPKSDESS